MLEHIAPNGGRASRQGGVHALTLAREQEVAEPARKQVVRKEQQQARVELERGRELIDQLPHAVQELHDAKPTSQSHVPMSMGRYTWVRARSTHLDEHGRPFRVVVLWISVPNAVLELVAKC